MKNRFLLILIITLIGCNNQQDSSVKEKIAIYKIDDFITRFEKSNADMYKNDLSFKKAEINFRKELTSFIIDSLGISDLPMYAYGMDNENMKDKWVKVRFKNKSETIKVFAIMDSTEALKIVQSASFFYTIPKYSKAINIDPLVSYSDRISLGKDYDYKFGTFVLQANEIKKIN